MKLEAHATRAAHAARTYAGFCPRAEACPILRRPPPPPPPQALKPASTELSCLELHVALDLGDCNAMILGGRGKRFEFLVTGDFFG